MAGTNAVSVALARNAVPPTDPVLALASTSAPTAAQTGSIAGLSPTVMGSYLNEFYAGRFSNAAAVWDVFERRDDTCAPVKRKRLAKIGREIRKYEIVPSEDTPRAQLHARVLEDFYANLRAEHALVPAVHGGLKTAVEFMADAIGKQYAFLAKDWRQERGSWRLTLRYVPLWYFSLSDGLFRLHRHASGQLNGEPVDPARWVIAARTVPVMEAAGVCALFKRLPMHQLVRILEKWGIPNVYGQTDADVDSPEWNALYNAVNAFISDMVAVIKSGSELKTMDSAYRSANLHRPWIDRCDRVITVNWLGGDLGTMAQSGSGTLAGGAQAEDTDDLVADDCDWLSEICQEQLDRDAILYETGDTEPLAYFQVVKPDAKDDKADMIILKDAVNMGARIPTTFLHERFSLPQAEAGEEFLSPVNPYASLAQQAKGATTDPEAAEPGAAPAAPNRRRAAVVTNAIARDVAAVDALMEQFRGPVGRAYAARYEPLIETIRQAPNLTAAMLAAEDYTVPDAAHSAYVSAIADMIAAGVRQGYVPARPEIAQIKAPNALAAAGVWLRRKLAANADLAPLPFDEAEVYAQALAAGLTVAGITDATVLGQIGALIGQAVDGQWTIDQLVAELVDAYGIDAAHAFTIVQTNLQSAYQWGHYQQLTDPAVMTAFPIWGWDVVLDDSTSDVCLPLAGRSAPANDPVWAELYPPNHYNCRTGVYPISTPEEAAELGFAHSADWPVSTAGIAHADVGFQTNIGTQPLSELFNR